MTSYMTIMVRVVANRAQAVFARLRGEIAAVETQTKRANAIDPMGRRHLTSLMKFGNQLQWTGRMIQYNFTLPLAIAAGAATTWALENEKAMVHVEKVYGDVSEASKQFRRENKALTQQMAEQKATRIFRAELEALQESFIAISNYYGVAQKEVLEVAGAWAAAGASGLDLAKSVDATMQAIIIGDMEAAAATKALISIQAQYNLNSEELMGTLAQLNSVENATGASMQDLIVAFEKSAGVARSAGIETQQLAAYVAALVPASGSAATAGNALKTIFSRLVSPTKETVQVLEAMGLSMDDMGWKSATVAEQLELMSEKFQGLSDKQKNVVSSVAASRWQVNRFDILMKELQSDIGFYAKALESADDAGENFQRMQKELNTVLESDPRRLQRIWVMLQNASADIIQPLIPYIIYLAQVVAGAVTAFSNLDPQLQKLILFGLVFLGLIGPIIRYMGALGTLFGVLGFALRHSVGYLFGMVTALGKLGTPLQKLGSLVTGSLGRISSLAVSGMSGLFSIFTGAFARILSYTTKFWTIQIGIWRAGFALQMLNLKLFYLSFLRFWALVTLTAPTRWAAMWVVLKTITIAALSFQVGILGTFSKAWTKLWALTALVTTNIWGRMAVMMALLTRNLLRTIGVLMLRIVPILLGPWGIAVAAIVAVLYAFRQQIVQIWNNIVAYFANNDISGIFVEMANQIMRVFNMLPQGVQDAMIAVVTVVRDAALAVYEWFSYINPFAQHSPSLVQNVQRGVDTINAKFAELSNVKPILASVYAEIKKFGSATRNLNLSGTQIEVKEDRRAIRKAGGGGAALASYDRMQKLLRKLNPLLAQTEARMNAQEAVVNRWQRALDEANDKLEEQQEKLTRLQDKLAKWQDKLDEAQSRLDSFANAPLKGMREMEDQIFANTMAQTRLRYEMMQMEKVVGTFDDLQEKMASINGLQEILRGTQTDLRSAGAGSEILGQYDAEIKKLEEQKGTYTDTFDKLNDMRLELERLQQQAEELDLVKALKFDELQYQIDRTADQTQELSFDEIISGILTAQSDVAKYAEKVADATAAVRQQEDVVAEAEKARDRVQERLDREQATLDKIRDRYDAIKDAIDAINTSIQDVVASAEKMNAELERKKDAAAKKKDELDKGKKGAEPYISPGLQNFMDAAGGNYPDPGGSGMPPRSDWSSQVKDIEDWTAKLSERTADMFADINPFATLKDKAQQAWNWIVDKAENATNKISNFFGEIFEGVDFGGGLSSIQNTIEPIAEFITGVFEDIGDLAGAAWRLLGPDITKIATGIWDGLKDIWERVGPELVEFKELWEPIGQAIGNFWTYVKPILALIAGAILGAIKIGISIVSELIDPAFDLLGDLLSGVIKVVRGILKVIAGLFNGDLPMILDGVKDIFSGLWDIIWGIFTAGVRLVWNVVEGFVEGVIEFFVWLWDELVGSSIVPDIINGIIDWFAKLDDLAQWVWDHVLKPVYDFFVDAYEDVIDEVSDWWAGIKDAWGNIKDNVKTWWLNNVWDPVKEGITNWWNNRLTVWSGWWADIKQAWNNITSKQWWLDNVWSPIATGISNWWANRLTDFASWWGDIKQAWNNITSQNWWLINVWQPIATGISNWWANRLADFAGWWENLKNAWGNIKENVGDWWKNNITDPIYNKVTGVFTDIANWFAKSPNLLKDAIRPMVNGVISGVNKIINGLNTVSDKLPGLDFHINPVPEMAAGGIPKRKATRGFMTNGARAIVGEGKANYPEYVIPTDPTFRHRARNLLASAANKLGIVTSGIRNRTGGEAGDLAKIAANSKTRENWAGTPLYAGGGILGAIKSTIGDLANAGTDWVVNKGRDMVSFIANPFLNKARDIVNEVDWNFLRGLGHGGLDAVERWIKHGDTAYNEGYDAATGGPRIRAALEWAKDQAGKPYVWGASGPGGYDCSGFMSAITNHLRGKSPYSRVGSTGTFPWTGFTPGAAVGKGFTIGSSPNYGGTGIGHMAGTLGGVNVESAGGVGVRVGPYARGHTDRGFSEVAHLSMKTGAIIRRRTGGTTFVATMGEGDTDEAVVPLPRNWKGSGFGGQKYYYFYGDLSFPNIRSGDDAEILIQNLENMAND